MRRPWSTGVCGAKNKQYARCNVIKSPFLCFYKKAYVSEVKGKVVYVSKNHGTGSGLPHILQLGMDDDEWVLPLTKKSRSGFGGLEVACWPLVPKFAGSNPAEAVGFFRVKKSSARLPSEGK